MIILFSYSIFKLLFIFILFFLFYFAIISTPTHCANGLGADCPAKIILFIFSPIVLWQQRLCAAAGCHNTTQQHTTVGENTPVSAYFDKVRNDSTAR